jgi:hypothetical protein
MPEVAIATTEAPTEPQTPAAPQRGGIDAMMAQLDSAAASGKPIETPKDKPVAAAAPAAPAKPAATPAPAPAKPAAAAKPPEPEMSEQEMEKVIKANPKAWRVFEAFKKKALTEKTTLEARIRDIESKPAPTAADDQKLTALNKQLEELRGESTKYKQELVKRDYTASDEYKSQYVERVNNVYAEAVAFVQQLRVEDNGTERAATQADFDEIRALPLGARNKAARAKFGEYATDVLGFTRDIDGIRRDATLAVQRHAEAQEKEAQNRESMTAKEKADYDNYYKASLDGVRANEAYGKWFSPDEADPEATKLLTDGFEEIEKVTGQLDKLPMDQRAAYSAVFRARAAATPRLIMEINRRDTKISELETELAKYRDTDPGAETRGGELTPGSEKKGIREAAAEFDNIPR